jgi:hypothetical protein
MVKEAMPARRPHHSQAHPNLTHPNRYKNKDAFQPLMFQTITKAGKRTDLYPSTFGKMPELSPLLGDNTQVASVLGEGLTLA